MGEENEKRDDPGGAHGLPSGPADSDTRGEAQGAAASPGQPSEAVKGEPTPAALTASAPSPTDGETAEESISRQNAEVLRRMRQQTRRSFLVAGAAALAGFGGFRWLTSRRTDDGAPWPLRQVLRLNEQLARDYFRRDRLAPAFPPAAAGDRVNGDVGLDDEIDVSSWQLSVEGIAGRDEPLILSLDAIKKLPRVEMTTEFKCIEGWSKVMRWGGARFSDFMAAYPPTAPTEDDGDQTAVPPPYVAMETPDGAYYVGIEMESMLHPQTLLAYEMNGSPLTQEHGAPLRLVITIKYGVKNLKRIGTIRYSRARPADYWAERGYDWYIGL
ncbi:MAG: molybdopterin-dependent oxidoreductase [Terriglobia bacterium]